MPVVRNVVSMPALYAFLAVALASVSLGGCYDLSTSGPRPEDFVRAHDETETQEQGQTGQRVDAPAESHGADLAAQDDSARFVEALQAFEVAATSEKH
ncbi:MAG: hypothetical protein JWP87_2920 [Labilithrix sp.]|nr:hypothetical protein [Labilithrix sp.]